MKKIIYISIKLTFCLFLFSCNKQANNSFEEKLTGGNYKYWILIKSYPTFEWDTLYTEEENISIDYFDKNGKFYFFNKRDIYSKLYKDADNPAIDFFRSYTWNLENDSLLSLNEDPYFQIKILEDDLMVLYNIELKKTYIYLPAPSSLIPLKP